MSDYKAHTGTGPNKERQEGPHVHFGGFAPDRSGAWFVDLGLDTALFYEVHEDTGKLVHMPERDIDFPKGTGPRHFPAGRLSGLRALTGFSRLGAINRSKPNTDISPPHLPDERPFSPFPNYSFPEISRKAGN